MRGDERGQLAQDAFDFARFFAFEFAHAVAHLDGRERFDEDRRAARARVVDDPRNFAFRFRANRNDVPSIALCDDRFLNHLRVCRGGEEALQFVHQTRALRVEIAADAREFGRRRVRDFAALIHRARNRVDDRRRFFDQRGARGEARIEFAQSSERAPQSARGDQRLAQIEQFDRRDQRADARAFCQRANIARAADAHFGMLIEERDRFGRLALPARDFVRLNRGREFAGELFARGKFSMRGKPGEDFIEFEGTQEFRVHRFSVGQS